MESLYVVDKYTKEMAMGSWTVVRHNRVSKPLDLLKHGGNH